MAIPEEHLTGVDAFTARRIRAICERLLVSADVAGVLPTPLDRLAESAGIAETLNIADLPPETTAPRPSWLKKIIGAYAFREKVVYVDRAQRTGRARFTEAHETVHAVLPWHHDTYTFDDDTIFQDTRAQLDAEANLGAGYLVFQGDRFIGDALNYETRLSSAIALRERYGASAHATIRYFTIHHPDEVGLLVCGRFPHEGNKRLPVWFAAESDAFRQRFDRMAQHVSRDGRNTFIDQRSEPFLALALRALVSPGVVSDEATILDRRGDLVRVWLDGWYNQFNVFIMATRRRRIRRGQRVIVAVPENSESGL